MEQILKFISNNGFAIVMCLLLFFKMLPRLDKMEETIDKDSQNTEKVEKTIGELKDIIKSGLIHSIDRLTEEVRRMNNKK